MPEAPLPQRGLSIESKSSIPTSATITDWATIVGVVLALGILAMTIGLDPKRDGRRTSDHRGDGCEQSGLAAV